MFFLIAATNTFIGFIHFRFGVDYMEYLDAPDEASQRALVNDTGKDTFVYMQRTEWFNVEEPKGRSNALCHVLGLVRWHSAQERSGDEADLVGATESGEDDYEASGSDMDTDE